MKKNRIIDAKLKGEFDMIRNLVLCSLIVSLFFIISCKKNEAVNNPVPPVSSDYPVVTQFATWINVWDRSSESWWNPNEHNGATVYVNGKWQSINWKDNNQTEEFIKNMKGAGINILICDLTNGWSWLDYQVQYIQSLCAKKGMKVCIAENSGGDIAKFESHAHDIWNNFAGPSSPYATDSTYLLKDGKPVIVCYGIRSWYNNYKNSSGIYRQKFNLVWASGEDSEKDKWGWQLEPWVASVSSSDAMFITPAIKWKSQPDLWRSSLSWLDYNFLLAKKNNPKYIIVGSYDDLDERNGWLVANTANCIPGLQMRNKNGTISTDAYYNRVKEWIEGNPSSISGGIISDGCYRIINQNSKMYLSLRDAGGKVGARLVQNTVSDTTLNNYFWFYHLGNNRYRIIALNNGLPLTIYNGSINDGEQIVDSLDADIPEQKWDIKDAGGGYLYIINYKSGKVMAISGASNNTGAPVVQETENSGAGQLWKLDKILSL